MGTRGDCRCRTRHGLLADTDAYFAALTSYRAGAAAPIVDRFSQATVLAIANGRQLVADIRDIRENWNSVIRARSDSAVWKVADLLTRRPVVNAALLAQELDGSPELSVFGQFLFECVFACEHFF